MSSPAEECYLMNHTLYGVVQREAEDDEEQSEYDPMEAAEARWEAQNGR